MANDLDYPVLIVTAAAEGSHGGCLVGFATQCSVHPLRHIVFISKKNRTHGIALSGGALGVHAVPSDRMDLAELFGGETGDEVDKFDRVAWRQGPEGLRILVDCPKWFVGTILERLDTGDHTGFLLAPVAGDSSEGRDLGFGTARSITPGHEP
jgi:flavin reductase (DIM6/NTAB) family NADH-FMN oxidoreductase RutF